MITGGDKWSIHTAKQNSKRACRHGTKWFSLGSFARIRAISYIGSRTRTHWRFVPCCTSCTTSRREALCTVVGADPVEWVLWTPWGASKLKCVMGTFSQRRTVEDNKDTSIYVRSGRHRGYFLGNMNWKQQSLPQGVEIPAGAILFRDLINARFDRQPIEMSIELRNTFYPTLAVIMACTGRPSLTSEAGI